MGKTRRHPPQPPPRHKPESGTAAGPQIDQPEQQQQLTEGTDDVTSPSTEPKPSRRRISHISKACNGCRRRKMKCDGALPSCAICKIYNEPCIYNPEQDGRRSAPRVYVAALEERVRQLEGTLRRLGLEQPPLEGASINLASKADEVPDLTPRPRRQDRLRTDHATGQLRQYGPFTIPGQQDVDVSSLLVPTSTTSGANVLPIGAGAVNSPMLNERPAVIYPQQELYPPPTTPELDEWQHDEALRLFFGYYNPSCGWVNDQLFLRDMYASPRINGTPLRPRRTDFYSPMLHNAILAVGAGFLDATAGGCEMLCDVFQSRARALLEAEAEQPMLSTVSALLLMASWYYNASRESMAAVYAGAAVCLLENMGLGSDCSRWLASGHITDEAARARYNVYYSAYILDKLWGTHEGCVGSLSWSNSNVPFPTPDALEDRTPWKPIIRSAYGTPREGGLSVNTTPASSGQTFHFGQVVQSPTSTSAIAASPLSRPTSRRTASSSVDTPGEPIPSWRSTAWVWSCRLSMIAETVLKSGYGSFPNTSTEMETALRAWSESLPEPLRISNSASREEGVFPGHILDLHAYYNYLVILVYRPWFARLDLVSAADALDPVREKCTKAAASIIQILGLYRRCPGLRFASQMAMQGAFAAGVVQLMTLMTLSATTSGMGASSGQVSVSSLITSPRSPMIHHTRRRSVQRRGSMRGSSPRSSTGVRNEALGAVQECVLSLQEMGETSKLANRLEKKLRHLVASHTPPASLDDVVGEADLARDGNEGPSTTTGSRVGDSTLAGAEINIEDMLQDAAVTAQLVRLGWLPPTSSRPTASESSGSAMSNMGAPSGAWSQQASPLLLQQDPGGLSTHGFRTQSAASSLSTSSSSQGPRTHPYAQSSRTRSRSYQHPHPHQQHKRQLSHTQPAVPISVDPTPWPPTAGAEEMWSVYPQSFASFPLVEEMRSFQPGGLRPSTASGPGPASGTSTGPLPPSFFGVISPTGPVGALALDPGTGPGPGFSAGSQPQDPNQSLHPQGEPDPIDPPNPSVHMGDPPAVPAEDTEQLWSWPFHAEG